HRTVLRITSWKLSCSQRQDQPPALSQSVEPRLRRLRGAGTDINDVSAVEQNACTVALRHVDVAHSRNICGEPPRQPGIEFNRRDPPLTTDQSLRYRRVTADPCTDMNMGSPNPAQR